MDDRRSWPWLAGWPSSCTASGLTAPNSAGPERPYLQHDNHDRSIPIGGSSSSTQRWNGVPRGTMDEVSPLGRLDLPTATQGRPLDCSTSPRIPCWKGPGADSEEKREPVSDIDIAVGG